MFSVFNFNNVKSLLAFQAEHENLTDVFSKKEKLNILKHRYSSLSGSEEPQGF